MSAADLAAPVALSDPSASSGGGRRGTLGATAALVWLIGLSLMVVLQPVLPLPDPNRSDFDAVAAYPFTSGHVLGTDEIGRDILARLIAGARVSLVVGLSAIAFAVLFGSLLGVLAGYFGGAANRVISGLVDIMLAFPALVALIALGVFMGPGVSTMIIGIGLVTAPAVARVARSASMTFAGRDFVTAARGMGATHLRVLWREILPNVVIPVLSYAMVLLAVAVIAEAALSFLGLGVPPPAASWGSMMSGGVSDIDAYPHIVLIPAVAMFLTLLSINLLAEHFSRRFDIKEAAL